MTHDEIAAWAASRVKRMGYPIAFANMTSAIHGEQPDVLGVNCWSHSILIEVKVSRSDFLADKKKPWRANPKMGIGDRRVYLTPKGLLKPEEIPYGWELWEIDQKDGKKPRLKIIKGRLEKRAQGGAFSTRVYEYVNCDVDEYKHFAGMKNDKTS